VLNEQVFAKNVCYVLNEQVFCYSVTVTVDVTNYKGMV